ncbi:RmlC-like cupin domain-containing protein [Haematococcus lacustris]
MSTVLRSVGRVVQLHQQRISAGFSAFRLNGAQLNVDPLLNIDWFDMSQPIFRPHPHAGFSAVTYLLPGSPGSFMNRDSRGNKEPIHPGDVHWTTAGSGVVHEEVPVQAGVSCQGLQIFVNLPPQLKSVEPRADHLSSDAIPLYSSPDNAKVRVIAGSVGGVTSPLQLVYPVTLLHVQLPQGSSLQHKVPPGHTVLLLVLEGEVRVAQGLPAAPSSWTYLPFASAADMQGEGEVQLHGPAEGSEASSGQVLLFSGQPIGAPVVWRGPFCGNSTAEVERWARAYQAGSMGSLEASF